MPFSHPLLPRFDSPVGRRIRVVSSLLFTLALSTCTSEPTLPNGGGYARVALQPEFASDVNLAALSLPLDGLRLILVRQPGDTLADSLVSFSLNADTLRLSISVRLKQEAETLQASLQLLSGLLPLFSGTSSVVVKTGNNSGSGLVVPVSFVGPGSNIASLLISPRDTFLSLGGLLQLQLDARDGQGQPVAQFYAKWSSTGGALINAAGVLQIPNLRGNNVIKAELPNGVKDSTRVWFVPLPTALELLAGDGQSGPIGTLLGNALRVRVVGQDGLGVGGAVVRFRSTVGGGLLSDSVVVTDTLGIAQVSATLGTLIGTQTFEASVNGLTPILFNLTATAGIPVSIVANSVLSQAATILAGVTTPPSVLVRDAQDNPVPGVTVSFAVTAGGGTILPAATVVTNGSGVATLTSWVLGALAGSNNNIVQASVTGLTGSPVSFTASGLVGAASQLAILTQPGTLAGVGLALVPQPVIQLRDAGGNDVAQTGVTVTASVATSPGGTVTLFSPSAVTGANGRATFSALSITGLLGNYTLQFAAPGVTGVVSNVIGLGVGAVSAAQSLVAATPASILADSAAPVTVTVTARDIGGNPIANATVVIAATGTGNVIAQPAAVTNASGVATGAVVTTEPGAKTISATANGVSITQTVPVTATTPLRIAFGGDSLGGAPIGIFRVNSNGTVRRNLATLGADFSNPRFSPDGSRVVFSATPIGFSNPGIHIAASDGTGFATVVTDSFSIYPRYNSNGTHIAFQCGSTGLVNRNVCVVPNVNGPIASLTNVGNGAGKIVLTNVLRPARGGPAAFAWNPTNANQIATIRDTSLGSNTVLRLFISNFDGTGSVFPNGVPIIVGADSNIVVNEISWSPNGAFLILAGDVFGGQRRLYYINANGTGLRQMTSPTFGPPEVEDQHPAISPDNSKVLFLRSSLDFEGNIWNFFVMPVTGSEGSQTQVTAEAPGGQDSDAIQGDWSTDGSQLVLTGTSVGGFTSVYIMPSTTTATSYFTSRQAVSGGTNRNDGSPSIRP